ncbi:hypothetical protein, partial [Hyphomonas sp.]|uniref:hypothetical protein n=1 Tax=Hyphomonas sp. TaxID=87 RepID=UPI0030F91EB3
DPAALDLPDDTLNLLNTPLDSFGVGGAGAEYFPGTTGAMFDLMAAADAAVSQTLGALLQPARVARLIETQRRDTEALAFEDVLGGVERVVFASPATSRQAGILRREQVRYASMLIDLASDASATPETIARTDAYLAQLSQRIAKQGRRANTVDMATRADITRKITAHLSRAAMPAAPVAPGVDVPPGSPIGSDLGEACWHCDTGLLR